MTTKNRTTHQPILLKTILFCLLFTVEFIFAQAALSASDYLMKFMPINQNDGASVSA